MIIINSRTKEHTQQRPGIMKLAPTLGVCLLSLCLFTPSFAQATDWLEQAEGVLGQFQQNAGQGQRSSSAGLSHNEMVRGLKEALQVGTNTVVKRLSSRDAFLADRRIHIPLPQQLKQARSLLNTVGMGSSLDDLENRMNRAAEKATPKTKRLLMKSIRQMTLRDAKSILHGSNDAATQYFKRTMSPELRQAIKPLIEQSLNQVGAVRSYDQMMASYRNIPMVPDLKADLNRHVVDGTLQGVFYYLAKEEAAIRQNPGKQTSALLRRLFAK